MGWDGMGEHDNGTLEGEQEGGGEWIVDHSNGRTKGQGQGLEWEEWDRKGDS